MGKIYKNGILFAGSTENARSVAFDNTDTGIEADNVQGAIEEIKDDVAEINSNLDDFNSIKKHQITSFSGITVGTTGTNAIFLVKRGNHVDFDLCFDNITTPNGSWIKICTLPEEYRSVAYIRTVTFNLENVKTASTYAIYITGSDVNIRNLSSNEAQTKNYLQFHISYVCK